MICQFRSSKWCFTTSHQYPVIFICTDSLLRIWREKTFAVFATHTKYHIYPILSSKSWKSSIRIMITACSILFDTTMVIHFSCFSSKHGKFQASNPFSPWHLVKAKLACPTSSFHACHHQIFVGHHHLPWSAQGCNERSRSQSSCRVQRTCTQSMLTLGSPKTHVATGEVISLSFAWCQPKNVGQHALTVNMFLSAFGHLLGL